MPTTTPTRNDRRALDELAELLADPLYWGHGAPRGDGRLVLVLPGLFGSDVYLRPLRGWLQRIGYRPVRSTLARNVGPLEPLTRRVEEELRRQMRVTPGPVALIGHSRGGSLARVIAARLQEQASHLILLGAPTGGLLRWLEREFGDDLDVRDRRLDLRGRRIPADLARPLSPRTEVVSIYSRDDRVVSSWAARVPGARNLEVSGSHSGLVYNRAVYHQLATILAGRDDRASAAGGGRPEIL